MKIKQRRRRNLTRRELKERERKARAKAKRRRDLQRRALLLTFLAIGLVVIISTYVADVGLTP